MEHSWTSFIKLLKDKSPRVRRDAAVALTYLREEELPSLIQFLRDEAAELLQDVDDRRGTNAAYAIAMTAFPESVVPGLVDILNDDAAHAVAKKEAACALRMLAPVVVAAKETILALMRVLLENDYTKTRRDAALALGAFGERAVVAVKPLVRSLKDKSPEVRAASARALGMIGQDLSSARSALATAARDDDPKVQIQAAAASAMVTQNSAAAERVIDSLLKRMAGFPDDGLALERVRALRMLEPDQRAIQRLADALKHHDRVVRAEAAVTLGCIRQGGVVEREGQRVRVEALVQALRDEDAQVRWSAVDTLRRIMAPAADVVGPLSQRLLEDGEAIVRASAALMLQQLGAEAGASLSALFQTVRDKNPAVCIRAILALTHIDPKHGEVISTLAQALENPFVEVRVVTLRALRELGSDAVPVACSVANLLEDDDPWVSGDAFRTLCAMVRGAALESRQVLSQALADMARSPGARTGIKFIAELIKEDTRDCAVVALSRFPLARLPQIRHNKVAKSVQNPSKRGPVVPTRPTDKQLADAYRKAADQLDVVRKAIHRELAARLQPHIDTYAGHLNAYVKSLPQSTVEEKRELVKWINNELRQSSCFLKCPKTADASLLQVDQGTYPEIGRFQFYHWEGSKKVVTASRNALPDLDVMPSELSHLQEFSQETGWSATEEHRRASRRGREKI